MRGEIFTEPISLFSVAQDDDPYVNLSVLNPRKSSLNNTTTLRKKNKTSSSALTIAKKFTFHVNSASRLNIDENARVSRPIAAIATDNEFETLVATYHWKYTRF